jgi:hypothetical protein
MCSGPLRLHVTEGLTAVNSDGTLANMNHSGLNFWAWALKGDALSQAHLCLAHNQRRVFVLSEESGCVSDLF